MRTPPRNPKFCGACGNPLITTTSPRALKEEGWMWEVLECSTFKGPRGGHYWSVLREWDEGPKYDLMTGERRR